MLIMSSITWKYFLVCCFWFFASLTECRSLHGYKFSVHTTQRCPRNQVEWMERSSILNCNASSYMCFPNEHFTELLEFCYFKRIHITPGTCMYLYGANSELNDYNCSTFTHGCPDSSYFSNETFKYQSCLSIGKGYFLAERSCYSNSSAGTNTNTKTKEECKQLSSTSSEERSDVVWIVVVTLSCVLIIICSIFHWIRKPRIRLPCALKLNSRDSSTSNTAINQDENTTFIAKADQYKDTSWQTNMTEKSYHADNGRVPGHNTHDTSTSLDSGISNYNGLSPLHIACVRGHHSTVSHLMKNDADINSCDNDGKTSLYLTCEYGHAHIVELLLNSGADVNICDNDGASPLYIACQQGNDCIVDLLLKHGADVNEKTNNPKLKTSE